MLPPKSSDTLLLLLLCQAEHDDPVSDMKFQPLGACSKPFWGSLKKAFEPPNSHSEPAAPTNQCTIKDG